MNDQNTWFGCLPEHQWNWCTYRSVLYCCHTAGIEAQQEPTPSLGGPCSYPIIQNPFTTSPSQKTTWIDLHVAWALCIASAWILTKYTMRSLNRYEGRSGGDCFDASPIVDGITWTGYASTLWFSEQELNNPHSNSQSLTWNRLGQYWGQGFVSLSTCYTFIPSWQLAGKHFEDYTSKCQAIFQTNRPEKRGRPSKYHWLKDRKVNSSCELKLPRWRGRLTAWMFRPVALQFFFWRRALRIWAAVLRFADSRRELPCGTSVRPVEQNPPICIVRPFSPPSVLLVGVLYVQTLRKLQVLCPRGRGAVIIRQICLIRN